MRKCSIDSEVLPTYKVRVYRTKKKIKAGSDREVFQYEEAIHVLGGGAVFVWLCRHGHWLETLSLSLVGVK